MIWIYTWGILILLAIYSYINITLLMRNKYWVLTFLFFYAYTLPILSNLVLEHGFYITEQERFSYFTGSTLRLFIYVSTFFLSIFFSLKLLKSLTTPLKFSINEYGKTHIVRKINKNKLLLLYIALFIEVLLYLNLLFSPIPLFSHDINRFNFWEYAKLPIFKKIFGAIALPLSIIFGVYFFYFSVLGYKKLRRITLWGFLFYIIYLYLIGHKFSPQFLAIYLFYAPTWIYKIHNKVPLYTKKTLVKLTIIACLFLVYIYYKYQTAGISQIYGGALFGMLYRIFVLQGHVYWGIDELVFIKGKYGVEYIYMLISKKLDGLLTLMHLIGPSNLDWYLEHNVRFTAGYPAMAIILNPYYAIFIQFILGFIIASLSLYTVKNVLELKIYKSAACLLILFDLYYALSMADFRVIYSPKLIFPAFYLFVSHILTKQIIKKDNQDTRTIYSNQ